MFRKVIFVLMMCVFQLGLCLLLFPVLNGFLLDRQAGQAAQSFLTQVDTPIEETQSIDSTEETIPYQQLWDEMCAYNETLYAEKQVSFDSPDDYEQPSFNLLDYGLEDEVFAVLTARKINLEMPVYLESHNETVCFFVNSVVEIYSIMNQFSLLENSAVYCAPKSPSTFPDKHCFCGHKSEAPREAGQENLFRILI